MQRAHAFIQIKRANAEARRITGIASTPATDRQGDQLDPMGARFRLPLPLLLGHDHNAPIGEVIEARATPQGIYVTCQIAPEGTTAKADEGWRAIRSGLIRGLSVGFIGKEWDTLQGGGRRFTEWEVIELSAVTVPANAEAAILEVKRLDQVQDNAPIPGGENVLPAFPRSLSKADRSLLAQGAADQWAGNVLAGAAKAGVKIDTASELLFKSFAQLLVQQRWLAERVEELEGKADGSA
ncbi:phage prohead protease, HK97 family [Paracoccus halophilus]|uniref:Phage prohead protease, HK97 family n=1 Tax=Paracoccus halophilus TaxID=376733 RepID=A0A1I0SJG1_9RHOB|nr:HK97 family phage prohead protease [Paracoccus halophilus]SFA39644.1 phage prohead protease, HK97 family [Paracoccus halophilus]